ncbi:MAG: hypothetical protein RQ754_11205 [Desulfuromonadales bacterium]|nr:hypothetical protein [Desulfuromonadales bacterium]
MQLTALILAVLCITGCINRSATDGKNLPEEELYIDAKLGFTILHPLAWTKTRVPVASPGYREDQLSWIFSEPNNSGSMLIKITPRASSTEKLADLLLHEIAELPATAEPVVESFPHALGEALKISGTEESTQRHFAIPGQQHAYIITFSFADGPDDDQYALLERVVSSLREL